MDSEKELKEQSRLWHKIAEAFSIAYGTPIDDVKSFLISIVREWLEEQGDKNEI